MASVKTLIKISKSAKEQQILLLIFPLFEVSLKSFVITSKFVVYVKFMEAVQRFVRQYNIPLLSYVFCDPAFFIGWKLFCTFLYLCLLTWINRQCLVFLLTFLQSWSNFLYQYTLDDFSLKISWLKFQLIKP